MAYEDLKDQPIEELVDAVQGLQSVASKSQVQSVAALGARLTIELSAELNGLTANVHTAKRQVVERLDSLTEVLDTTQAQLARASDEASQHTEALVRWTKVLAVVTAVYTVITGGLLAVTAFAS